MSSSSAPITVLVADDHPDTADSFAALLEMSCPEPLQAVAVYDGMQAVQAAAARPFDAAVLDIEMPALDGMAAGKAIRALRPKSHVTLIALSGNPAKVQAAGASPVFDAAFVKPVTVNRLLDVIFAARTKR